MTLFSDREALVSNLADDCVQNRLGAELPVIILLGPPGTGCTTLLDEVHQGWFGRAPVAALRTDRSAIPGGLTAAGLLAAAVVELSRKVEGGRLRFPRLLTGLAATSVRLPLDPMERRRALKRTLADRSTINAQLAEVISAAAKVAAREQLPEELANDIDTVLQSVNFRRATGALSARWSSAARWYRRNVPGISNGLDGLDWLNQMTWGLSGPPQLGVAIEVLCRAFLADLVASYYGPFSGNKREMNSLLLVHAVDEGPGAELLRGIETARRTIGPTKWPDPLLLVGISRRRFELPRLQERSAPEEIRADRPLVELSYGDWRHRRDRISIEPGQVRTRRYAVELPPISNPSDFRRLVAAEPEPATVKWVARVSGGHPFAAKALLQRAQRGSRSREAFAEFSGSDRSELVERLITRATGFAPNDPLREALVSLSMVPVITDDSRDQVLEGEQPEGLDRLLAQDLWVRHDIDAMGVRIQPILRRLLLHSLASREVDGRTDWISVNTRIIEANAQPTTPAVDGLKAVGLHHQMARGSHPAAGDDAKHGLRESLDHLSEWYGLLDLTLWLDELDYITSAPNASAVIGNDVLKEVESISETVGAGTRGIHHLSILHWLANDPLRDPDGVLDKQIADMYRDLAHPLPYNENRRILRRRAAHFDQTGG